MRGQDQPHDGGEEAADRTRAISHSPRRRRTRRWRSSASRYRRRDGKIKHRPFHSYTMKQAIEEGFILDVLKSYTPVNSYYKLVKTVEERSGVRHQEGEEEAAALCRKPRPRDSPQGRDHGGSLPRAGDGAEQDRRRGAGDGGDERHRAGDPVFSRDQRLSRRTEESVQGHRRIFGRARVRRSESERSIAQRVSDRARSRTRFRRTRIAS